MRHKTKAKLLRDALKRLRGSSESERLLHRLHSVVFVLNGHSASEAARLYKDSPRAVAYWVKRFEELGVNGLRSHPRPGRPTILTSDRLRALQRYILEQQLRGRPVNAKTVSQYIKSKY